MTISPGTQVWRYLSFAKFVSLLLHKRLWLSSAEYLEDKWELMPDSQQINALINNCQSSKTVVVTSDTIAADVKIIRQTTFINCWSVAEHESYALWRIYCPSSEGVAIQTTYDRLQKSVGLPVLEVKYNRPETNDHLDALELVTHKRPMFAYEHEVRIVLFQDYHDPKHPDRNTIGTSIDWDPEQHIENIWLHPDTSIMFMDTVGETVRRLAPKLAPDGYPRLFYSKLSLAPPIK